MNLPTLIVALIVFALFAAIVWKSVSDKKKGKTSCSYGGGCGQCPMSGKCHANTPV